jgi:intracellular multiplication protein IcmL
MSGTDKAEASRIAKRLHRTSDGVDAVVREVEDQKIRRSQKRELLTVNILTGIANLVLSIGVLIAIWMSTHVEPVYFAADNNRFLPLIPLSKPYRKTSDVIDYAKKSLDETFMLDFNNYQAQLEAVRDRYTQAGFKNIVQNLADNGTLNMIRSKRMNLTSTTGTGVLIQEGDDGGAYGWVIRFPLTLKLIGQTTEMPEQRLIATVIVHRIPTLDSVDAIGVSQIVTKPQ